MAQQTKNFADITRLNSAVSDKERKIAQLYQSIGQSYYEQHSGDAEPQLQPAVEEIKALFAEIAQHKEEIKQIKGIVKCPHCGADVPFQAAFCNALRRENGFSRPGGRTRRGCTDLSRLRDGVWKR